MLNIIEVIYKCGLIQADDTKYLKITAHFNVQPNAVNYNC